jgi:hypothetical protein
VKAQRNLTDRESRIIARRRAQRRFRTSLQCADRRRQ